MHAQPSSSNNARLVICLALAAVFIAGWSVHNSVAPGPQVPNNWQPPKTSDTAPRLERPDRAPLSEPNRVAADPDLKLAIDTVSKHDVISNLHLATDYLKDLAHLRKHGLSVEFHQGHEPRRHDDGTLFEVPNFAPQDVRAIQLVGSFGFMASDLNRLRHFSGLERLVLAGQISDHALSHLPELPRLKSLNLDGSSVNGFPEIMPNLSSLEEIHINGLGMQGFNLERLADACSEKLTRIGMRDNRLNGAAFEHLRSLKGLQRLDCGGNEISRPMWDALAQLPKLKHLGLDRNQITDAGLAGIEELQSLTRLDLNSNRLRDQSVPELAKLPNLQRLDLRDNGLRGSTLQALTARKFEKLSLDDNPLDAKSLPTLKGLALQFQSLRLDRMPFSLSEFADVFGPFVINIESSIDAERLPWTSFRMGVASRSVDYSITLPIEIGDAEASQIAAFPGLAHVDIRHSQLTDVGVAAFGSTPLETVKIRSTQVLTDDGVRGLCGNRRIKVLSLSNIQLTEVSMSAIGRLRGLVI